MKTIVSLWERSVAERFQIDKEIDLLRLHHHTTLAPIHWHPHSRFPFCLAHY